mmetsp:Transcript_39650/g.99240  ORF Transcript_39650/g.99240 Transcript_39650/m.99240 type:complete len:282 (-) Transcript_39650:45-890(-)
MLSSTLATLLPWAQPPPALQGGGSVCGGSLSEAAPSAVGCSSLAGAASSAFTFSLPSACSGGSTTASKLAAAVSPSAPGVSHTPSVGSEEHPGWSSDAAWGALESESAPPETSEAPVESSPAGSAISSITAHRYLPTALMAVPMGAPLLTRVSPGAPGSSPDTPCTSAPPHTPSPPDAPCMSTASASHTPPAPCPPVAPVPRCWASPHPCCCSEAGTSTLPCLAMQASGSGAGDFAGGGTSAGICSWRYGSTSASACGGMAPLPSPAPVAAYLSHSPAPLL